MYENPVKVEELAAQLVSFPTEMPPGNEEECAAYLRDYFNDLHIEGSVVEMHRFADKRANLVVRIGPSGKAGLLLSGHLDVVPAGDPTLWDTPAFEPKIREGRLYGRGAADMKGGVAAMVKAIETFKNKELERGIIFVATAGEEMGFDGLKALIRDGKLKDNDALYGVIGEPTELRPVRAHKGGTIFKITFHGRSAHSSRPDLGINAIENAAHFIVELINMRKRLGEIQDPDLGASVLSTTIIEGGIKENVIPESCQVVVDCRRIPSHSREYIYSKLEELASSLRERLPTLQLTIAEILSYDPLNTPIDHPLVKLCEEITGQASETAPYGTEGSLYQKLNIPTIILGPGSVKQAHIPNEYVEIKQLHQAQSLYEELIRRICL
ncbi:Acetylornithine deacetylase [Candidatus Calditenuaceae archaeon HR02]|nr:Acetylornithine deacetylase [Candidatus Calditenuaceae archaeon HR02]